MTSLVDKPPLRTTAILPRRFGIEVLPIGYGQVTLFPIRYDDGGYFHLVLDQPADLVQVLRDGEIYTDCELLNQSDATSQPISLLELAEPLTDGETLSVTVNARIPGQLVAEELNAAIVVEDFLSRISGHTVPPIHEFRSLCESQQLRIAGVIDDRYASKRAVVNTIMQSIGAIWHWDMPGFAQLWPADPDTNRPLFGRFTGQPDGRGVADSTDVRSRYELSNIATRLQIDFDWDYSENRPGQSVTYIADPQAITEYGDVLATLNAPWLRNPAVVDAVAKRLAPAKARPCWDVTFKAAHGGLVPASDLRPGVWVDIANPLVPTSGELPLQITRHDRASGEVEVMVQGYTGRKPRVDVIARSQVASGLQPDFFLTRQGDTVTLRTEPGALVELSGKAQTADNNGLAVFENTPSGLYELTITAVGFERVYIAEWRI